MARAWWDLEATLPIVLQSPSSSCCLSPQPPPNFAPKTVPLSPFPSEPCLFSTVSFSLILSVSLATPLSVWWFCPPCLSYLPLFAFINLLIFYILNSHPLMSPWSLSPGNFTSETHFRNIQTEAFSRHSIKEQRFIRLLPSKRLIKKPSFPQSTAQWP